MSHLLENLNDEQLAAVTHGEGALMIIAGAGTGKTTVVTKRIAWLIEQEKVKAEQILALTFTEKAATEMEERVDQLLPLGYLDLWISTFHAFCERVLKNHALEIGLPHEFKLVTEVDTLLLMRKNFERFSLEYFEPRGNPTRFLKGLLSHISRLKDEVITPEEYLAFAQERRAALEKKERIATDEQEAEILEVERIEELARAYAVYQEILLEQNALDFGDLLYYTIELFKKRPNILEKYREQFVYVLVDEFQDTNVAQYELVKLLAAPKNNLTVVGDDDQSIYRFRGASLTNIMKFREDYPESTSVVLNKNYRSHKHILDHAYTLIQNNNPNRLEARESLDKRLHSQTGEEGTVEHIHVASLEDEVEAVVKKIATVKMGENRLWSDFCVLVRANDSAEPFLAAFDQYGIPYRFMAMSGLYTKPLILDVRAYLQVIDQPYDSPSMYRVLNHPELGITEKDLSELLLFAKKKAKSLYETMQLVLSIPEVSEDGRKRIGELLTLIHHLQKSAKRLPAGELFMELIKESGIYAGIRLLNEYEQMEQFGYLQQFLNRLRKFEASSEQKGLHHFLEEFFHEREAGEVGSLDTDIEAGPDVVNVMTIHGSKGLEFPFVFVVNMVEQRFPSQRRSDPLSIPPELLKDVPGEGDHHLEEERRLMYVAMTRAKEGLFLFSADSYGGVRKRKPSRFLQELDLTPSHLGEKKMFLEEKKKVTTGTEKKSTVKYTLPSKISFTQIAAFTSCPMQYKFAHILKVPVFGKHQLSFGKTMHNTLQEYMKRLHDLRANVQDSLFDEPTDQQSDQIPSKDELFEIYESCWIDEWYPSEEVKAEYKEQGRNTLENVYAFVKENPPQVLYVEKGFTLKVGAVTVKGRIDRIDACEGGIEIVDYKTGRPKDKLSWQDKRQLVLYQMASEQCFDPPVVVKKLTYHYLEDNSILSFEATEKEKAKLEKEILDTVDLIKESDFSATPGFHCQYCDFKDICEFSEA